jgi:hypothetical protein
MPLFNPILKNLVPYEELDETQKFNFDRIKFHTISMLHARYKTHIWTNLELYPFEPNFEWLTI